MLAEMGVLQCIVEKKGQNVTADDLASQTGSDSLLISELNWQHKVKCKY